MIIEISTQNIYKRQNKSQNSNEFIEHLSQTRAKGYVINQLMNFIPIDREVGKSNTIIKTFYAILNQKTNKSQLVDESIQLAKHMGFTNSRHFEKYKEDILNQQQQLQKIVNWYTKQSFVYFMVNALLRLMSHPSQIFCLQPFIKQMFEAIRVLHKSCNMKRFSCYRGGFIGQKQLQYFKNLCNLRSIVQNLGFMSTSRKLQVAEMFAKNVLFIIQVPQNSEDSFGFADVKPFSDIPDEEQILFNPLNFFQLKRASKRIINCKQIDVFELSFAPSDHNLAALKKYQKQMVGFKCIGDVLVQKSENLRGSNQFVKKQIQMKKVCGANYPLRRKGWMHMNNGQFKLALQCYEQMDKNNQEDDIQRANNHNSLGNVYNCLGQYQKSLQFYKRCEVIRKKILGAQNLLYADTLNNIGVTFNKMGQHKKSLQFYRKCEEIRKITLGIEHPSYADTLNNIGLAYNKMGQHKKSLQFYRKCEEIRKITLGIEHPSYADTLNNIGIVYFEMGQYQKSLQFYEKCEKIRKITLGIEHPSYADILNNIGLSYSELGQYQKSLYIYNLCESIIKRKLGIQHPSYARIQNNMRVIYSEMQKDQQNFQSKQKIS